jgi:HEPN domain-containing protein
MIDIDKQINYWINNADSDFETAEFLISEKNKILHGLFFCHLCIEKVLKAHVTKNLNDIPPRSHDLLYLLNKTLIELDKDDLVFCGILMKYQLHGRYPEYNPEIPDYHLALSYLNRTKKLKEWIKSKL